MLIMGVLKFIIGIFMSSFISIVFYFVGAKGTFEGSFVEKVSEKGEVIIYIYLFIAILFSIFTVKNYFINKNNKNKVANPLLEIFTSGLMSVYITILVIAFINPNLNNFFLMIVCGFIVTILLLAIMINNILLNTEK